MMSRGRPTLKMDALTKKNKGFERWCASFFFFNSFWVRLELLLSQQKTEVLLLGQTLALLRHTVCEVWSYLREDELMVS